MLARPRRSAIQWVLEDAVRSHEEVHREDAQQESRDGKHGSHRGSACVRSEGEDRPRRRQSGVPVSERKFTLLTGDHIRVQRLVDAGMITPKKARDHP